MDAKAVLCGTSALEYWRSVRGEPHRYENFDEAISVINKPPVGDFGETEGPWWLTRPLHILVGCENIRRKTQSITTHLWSGDLPKGAALDRKNGFAIASPEFCFLLMARELPVLKLIELGFEFCGRYDDSGEELKECPPLSTVARMRSFAFSCGDARAVKNALRALKYVMDNSASPMETKAAMLLCLPYKLGGYGLSKPELNYLITVNRSKKSLVSKNFYYGDLYWPDIHVAVEYDSDLHHTGSEKISKDASRRVDLMNLGNTVISVTRKQILNRSDTERLAKLLGGMLGKRIRYKEPDFTYKNSELRRVLFAKLR